MKSNPIFEIKSEEDFQLRCEEVFQYQYRNSPVYKEFCDFIGRNPKTVQKLVNIPFLPVELFKHRIIKTHTNRRALNFRSSGTTGQQRSTHYVAEPAIYEQSFTRSFEIFYGDIRQYCILALLPSYLERQDSSLVYMVQKLIERSGHPGSGFYLDNYGDLSQILEELERQHQPSLLFGVSFALLEMSKHFPMRLRHTTIIETGGMKGRGKEMIRSDLHSRLKSAWGLQHIHSEYGMTELLSQAYAQSEGIFHSPSWMRVLIRDPEDPGCFVPGGSSGGINIIDLANLHSCSFIATQDLGKLHPQGGFEVLGRFDHSDIRGCNLMVM